MEQNLVFNYVQFKNQEEIELAKRFVEAIKFLLIEARCIINIALHHKVDCAPPVLLTIVDYIEYPLEKLDNVNGQKVLIETLLLFKYNKTIYFPENGICISFSSYNEEIYNDIIERYNLIKINLDSKERN